MRNCELNHFFFQLDSIMLTISKVTVIDSSDPDWWRGKCLGRVGFFPSKYCVRLQAGEKPMQVIQNLQISDGDKNGTLTLLRDQIVVQVIIYIILVHIIQHTYVPLFIN